MRYRAVLVAIAVVLVGRGANAQLAPAASMPIKKCDDPKVPLGSISNVTGTLTFRMGKDGKPDISSLEVTKVLGMSVAGYKSAAARLLGACRFAAEEGGMKTTVLVTAELSVRSTGVDVGAATVAMEAAPALALEAIVTSKDTMPYAFDDPALEERPRRLPASCGGGVSAPKVLRASGATAAEARANAMEQIRRETEQFNTVNAGTIVAVARIGIDGKPGSQLRVLESTNPLATQRLGDYIGSCRYAPGRVLGVPVPAFMRLEMTNGGMVVH